MITLPVVLIAVAAVLLLALMLGLFLQRRRALRAVPPGPRTVADLVAQRREREPAAAPAVAAVTEDAAPEPAVLPGPTEPDVVEASAEASAAAGADSRVEVEPVVDEPVVETVVVDEPVAGEPAASEPEPAEVSAPRAVTALGDDVPWRRAAQIAGPTDDELNAELDAELDLERHGDLDAELDPETPTEAEQPRPPALSLLSRPTPRPVQSDAPRPFTAPRLTAVPSLQERREGGAHRLIEPVEVTPAEPVTAEAAEAAPVAEPVPVAEPAPVAEVAPVAEPEPVTEPAPIDDSGDDTEQLAVTDAAPTDDAAAEPAAPVAPAEPVTAEPVVAEPAAEVEPAPAPSGATAAPTADEPSTGTVPKVAAATAAVAGTAVAASLLSRRWDEDPDRTGPIPTTAAAENGVPEADPDVLFDSPPPATAESTELEAAAPEAAAPEPAPEAAAEPEPEPVAPVIELPNRRTPRDPGHVAAEQAAADLALLRTFGDPSARPERAPVVALEGAARPEAPPAVGAAQPVRFRAVRHDGTEVASAAVALLDDRGREVASARTATGELTAPHPGAFVLVATAPDHQPGAVAVAVGDAPSDVEVQLVRSAALVGTVLGEDGPITGARVTLVQDGEVVEVAETDSDGAYLVADLAAGEYAVSVAAAGCEADVVLVVVAEESECVHDVELAPAGVRAG